MPFRVLVVSVVVASALALVLPVPVRAQTSAPEQNVTVRGYLQTQYDRVDEPNAPARDEVFFRRLTLGLRARAAEHWTAALQVDFAPATEGDRVVVKDAYLQYSGFSTHGLTLTIGNQKLPFSRSLLTSSSQRRLVERPFPGERRYGAPGRAVGIKADGWNGARTGYWSAAVGSALRSPDVDAIRVDGIAESDRDWNEGVLAAGRFEWHPWGETPSDHIAFSPDGPRIALGASAFVWRNDGDRNLYTVDGRSTSPALADADWVLGIEVSGGLRSRRVGMDAEYSFAHATTLDRTLGAGLYLDGRSRLHKASVESGFMVRQRSIELVGALDMMHVRAFPSPWRRAAGGLNWYLDGHRLRFQVMHRVSSNHEGVRGARHHATHVQAQIVF